MVMDSTDLRGNIIAGYPGDARGGFIETSENRYEGGLASTCEGPVCTITL